MIKERFVEFLEANIFNKYSKSNLKLYYFLLYFLSLVLNFYLILLINLFYRYLKIQLNYFFN